MEFEIGKKYMIPDTSMDYFGGCDVYDGIIFECHGVDYNGDCETQDVTHMGDKASATIPSFPGGWNIATPEMLDKGWVVEVQD